jgi:hypothetical protein
MGKGQIDGVLFSSLRGLIDREHYYDDLLYEYPNDRKGRSSDFYMKQPV